jgi:hypothetical protein
MNNGGGKKKPCVKKDTECVMDDAKQKALEDHKSTLQRAGEFIARTPSFDYENHTVRTTGGLLGMVGCAAENPLIRSLRMMTLPELLSYESDQQAAIKLLASSFFSQAS